MASGAGCYKDKDTDEKYLIVHGSVETWEILTRDGLPQTTYSENPKISANPKRNRN